MSALYTSLTVPIVERDHIQGAINAPIKLVEYGDYQCPYCGEAYPVVKALQRELGRDLCFAFRHFPLTTVHPHAELAAEAAEAAGAQGRFWEMHDLLFENQDALNERAFSRYAEILGLDFSRFMKEVSARAYAPRVREDFKTGVRSGVNGTPTFFINGERYDGDRALYAMLAALRGM